MDVTHRFLMECLRMYPIVPMSMRDVMNSCIVEGYELPVGSRLYIGQTAAHYMNEVFLTPSSSILTAICLRAVIIVVPGTPRTDWAPTHVSVSSGWNCNWPSTC